MEQDSGTVVLKDFDADTLGSLLDFMYTSTLTITEDNVQDILIGEYSAKNIYNFHLVNNFRVKPVIAL